MSTSANRNASLPPGLAGRLNPVCDRFEAAWLAGATPVVEDFLPLVDEADRPALLRELQQLEQHYRGQGHWLPDAACDPQAPPSTVIYADADARSVGEASKQTQTCLDTNPSDRMPQSASAEPPLPNVPGYDILGILGRGGMGVVYKARQINLKRTVALKMILSGVHAGGEELARFRAEAEAVARLQHPNIVQIFDIGDHAGIAYFSLELVEGGTLANRLKASRPALEEVAALAATLARAMDHAHQRGIVHRDLKPANVLLLSDGSPKITDFGLAKQLEGDAGQTRTGAVMGTPSYMAPEQALGQVRDIGPRTDVYALGAILYELLTGRPPFRGADVIETLEMVRTQDPIPPSQIGAGVPRDLETICLKALARDPQQRYASALAMANDLDRYRAGEPILARRESLAAQVGRKLRRHAGKLATALAVIGVVTAAVVMALAYRSSSRAAELEKKIVAALDEEKIQGTEEYAAQVEELILELESLDQTSAAEARRKLWERLGQWVQKEIREATDLAQAKVRLLPTIALIARNNSTLAKQLDKQLEERSNRWDPIFQLADSFADAPKVFAAQNFRIEGKFLMLVPSDKTGVVPTKENTPPYAEARVVFAPASWEGATHVGLVLHASAKGHYAFVLQLSEASEADPKVPVPPSRTPMQQARNSGGMVLLQIRRNGVVLAQQKIPAAEVPAGPLSLWVRREGEHLTCQLNRFKVVEFLDPFPLGTEVQGVFGLMCSHPVAVQSYAAFRKSLAVVPGLLEKGDALFEAGHYDEAAQFYARQAVQAGASEWGQQARYREALCVLESKREKEAIPLLQALSNEPGNRWPVLADFRLCLLFLDHNDADSQKRAEAIVDRLLGRNLRDDEIVMLLPENSRQRFLDYNVPERFEPFFAPTKDRVNLVRQLQRRVSLERLVAADFLTRKNTELTLIRMYRLADMEAEAELLAQQMLSGFKDRGFIGLPSFALTHLCWTWRRHGRANDALIELERWISGEKSGGHADEHSLLMERARAHIQLQNWPAAEKDVDEVLRRPSGNPSSLVDAHCLKGFLRERLGDLPGARAAWKEGIAAYGQINQKSGGYESMTPFITYWIMASLVGDMNDAECRRIQQALLARVAGQGQVKQITEITLSQQPTAVYREMWRTARGRDTARQWVYRQCSFAEFGLLPFYLNAAETLHQIALPGPLSPEHDLLIWNLIRDAHRDYADEKLSKEQIITIGLTLKGVPWFWDSVESKLNPPVRAPLLYLLGHRYLGSYPQQAKQAAVFFQSALAAAPEGSTVRRLTQTELGKLKKSTP